MRSDQYSLQRLTLKQTSPDSCGQHWKLNVDEITKDLHPASSRFSKAQLGKDSAMGFQELK
jgi:hypothetical protein